jgi:hypothetical protein
MRVGGDPPGAAAHDDGNGSNDDASAQLPSWGPKVCHSLSLSRNLPPVHAWQVFRYMYLSFISNEVMVMSWISAAVVAVLLLTFARQFVIELRTYARAAPLPHRLTSSRRSGTAST